MQFPTSSVEKDFLDPIELILSDGFYAVFQRNLQSVFPDDQLAVIDGNQFLTEPWRPLKQIQKFVGVQQFINENNFVTSKNGLPCFHQSKSDTAGPVLIR